MGDWSTNERKCYESLVTVNQSTNKRKWHQSEWRVAGSPTGLGLQSRILNPSPILHLTAIPMTLHNRAIPLAVDTKKTTGIV
jgi:hypothetical protein